MFPRAAVTTADVPSAIARPRRTAALLAILLLGACGGEPSAPIGPDDELSVRQETARGVYFHAPGDAVALGAQDAYYEWLFAELGVEPARKLVYLKYRDRAHMQRLTGHDTNGWAELGTHRFHTISELDNHESVHALVSSEWNAAPALMNEGIAVAHQVLPHLGILEPVWSGTPIDTVAARALRDGTLPSLGELVESSDFRRIDESLSYPLAGSFVRFVIERHGYERTKSFFRSSRLDDPGTRLRAVFREAFGEEIETAWNAWRSSLD